jgi:hypothetical protein
MKIHFSIFAHGKIKSKYFYRTIPIIMKKLDAGERWGPSRFLPAHIPEISWNSYRNSGNFLKISGIVSSLDRKRFPSWADEK